MIVYTGLVYKFIVRRVFKSSKKTDPGKVEKKRRWQLARSAVAGWFKSK
jgi:hypothetical protein